MKKLGLVRKIDTLGRIVLPKELRNTLNINENDDLEIYVEEDKIILKKYYDMDNNLDSKNKLFEIISNEIGIEIYISDKEKIISQGCLYKKDLTNELRDLINDRKDLLTKDKTNYFNKEGYYYFYPIIKNSDAKGLIILFSKNEFKVDYNIISKLIRIIIQN